MNRNKFEVGDLVWNKISSNGHKTPTWIGLVSSIRIADHCNASFEDLTQIEYRKYYVYHISWVDNRKSSWIPEYKLEVAYEEK